MNDNDIIKALECCIDCKCKECPCYRNIDGEMRCTEIDEEQILDLINRQRAEIENLKVEKLKHFLAYEKDRKRVKFEAIKEFAERLKEISRIYLNRKEILTHGVSLEEIDNLAKEMAEGL